MARHVPATAGLGSAGAAPPLPAGLPPDAAKHAAALWSFLDELAEDPKARQPGAPSSTHADVR
jgi:hypothetical protein